MPKNVQEYLSTKTLDDLTAEFAIVVKRHETMPLAILNYDQIESVPKGHPIIRACRGLVVRTDTNQVVARSFSRFFNWGEMADEMGSFDFSDFIVQTKHDGSLVVIYHFDGRWHANTRGSYAVDLMQGLNFTWREGICKALGVSDLQEMDEFLDVRVTYVCEFCSPWNKIVRRYEKPALYLLTAFVGHEELPWTAVDDILPKGMLATERHEFHNMEEIKAFLDEQASKDPTFEGVVIRDKDNNRWKIKNLSYMALHRLRGEGDNLFMPKNLLPFVLSGEQTEVLTYFPEIEESLRDCEKKVNAAYEQLEKVWRESLSIEGQKEFALAIQGKTPFTGLLFTLRKLHGNKQTVDDLKKTWRQSSDVIIKQLFKN